MYPVITISREFGSGGHIVGEKVAEKLGIPFYGREIRNEVAKRLGISLDESKRISETATAGDKFFNGGFAHRMFMEDDQDRLFEEQRKYILELAEKEPCVIVGRCADAILAEEGIKVLNVFIHADIDYRIENAKESYGLSDECDEKYIKKIDKSRKYYHKFYGEEVWGDYANYQLSLNSGAIGQEACVNIIIEAAKAMED